MDNDIYIIEVTAEKVSEMIAEPQKGVDYIQGDSDDRDGADRVMMNNCNGWQTIHLLLADDPWGGTWPLNFMASVDVGTSISYDDEYPPATLFNPEEVKAISDALQEITPLKLAERFDPDDRRLSEVGAAIELCSSPEEFFTKWILPDYNEIRDFVSAAAGRNQGLLVFWRMG
jgi:hypothetical protein